MQGRRHHYPVQKAVTLTGGNLSVSVEDFQGSQTCGSSFQHLVFACEVLGKTFPCPLLHSRLQAMFASALSPCSLKSLCLNKDVDKILTMAQPCNTPDSLQCFTSLLLRLHRLSRSSQLMRPQAMFSSLILLLSLAQGQISSLAAFAKVAHRRSCSHDAPGDSLRTFLKAADSIIRTDTRCPYDRKSAHLDGTEMEAGWER